MVTPSFTLPSFAKINWSLRVLGKRPDGYHEVRTLLQTISLRDELHFELRDDEKILLSCNDTDIPRDDRNLIVRAARALQDRYQATQGVNVCLEKRIPVKAGLGGASSNAAIALVGLSKLWNLQPAGTELHELAAALGADVPFFLVGGRAQAIGTGTEVIPGPDPATALHLIVVAPRASVSTATAYAALNASALTTFGADSILSISREQAEFYDSDQWPATEELQNDFERVIFDIEPEIERARNALVRAGARGALLAGSGSGVFGIFDNLEAQQQGYREIQAEVGWRIFPCVTLSREEYFRALGPCGIPLLRSFDLGVDTGA